MAKFRLITEDPVLLRFVARDAHQIEALVMRRDGSDWTKIPPEPSADPSVQFWRLPADPSLYTTLGQVLIRTGAPGEAAYDRLVEQAGQLLKTQSKNPRLISGTPDGGIFIGSPEFVELLAP